MAAERMTRRQAVAAAARARGSAAAPRALTCARVRPGAQVARGHQDRQRGHAVHDRDPGERARARAVRADRAGARIPPARPLAGAAAAAPPWGRPALARGVIGALLADRAPRKSPAIVFKWWCLSCRSCVASGLAAPRQRALAATRSAFSDERDLVHLWRRQGRAVGGAEGCGAAAGRRTGWCPSWSRR